MRDLDDIKTTAHGRKRRPTILPLLLLTGRRSKRHGFAYTTTPTSRQMISRTPTQVTGLGYCFVRAAGVESALCAPWADAETARGGMKKKSMDEPAARKKSHRRHWSVAGVRLAAHADGCLLASQVSCQSQTASPSLSRPGTSRRLYTHIYIYICVYVQDKTCVSRIHSREHLCTATQICSKRAPLGQQAYAAPRHAAAR